MYMYVKVYEIKTSALFYISPLRIAYAFYLFLTLFIQIYYSIRYIDDII